MSIPRAFSRATLFCCLQLLPACALTEQEPAAESDPHASESAEEASFRARAAAVAGYGFVASEFLPIDEVAAALPLLARYDLDLVVAWPAAEIDNPRWYEVVRMGAALGVTVSPWLTLAESDGYFANSTNATTYDATMRRLVERWLAEGLPPAVMAIDMELPLNRIREFSEIAAAGDAQALVTFFRAGIDREQYAQATNVYRVLVDFLHEHGFEVEYTTLGMVLDDYDDGDDGIRQGMQVPLDGIAWDRLAFQLHRTLARNQLGDLIGPNSGYFVYDYARRAHERFGTRAAAYLGLTDPGIAPDVELYNGPNELREDVDAALAAGLVREHVAVFSLRGLLGRPDQERWFAPASRLSLAPAPDLATSLMRTISRVLDSAL